MIHTKHQKLIEHVLVVMHGMEQLAEPICVCVKTKIGYAQFNPCIAQ